MCKLKEQTSVMFSIIVPVYNAEKYLRKCIESVLFQSFSEFELILVNDGSEDDSPIMCETFAKKDKRIKVIHQKNGGQTSARKAGLKASIGQYILFLDSDDWIDSQTVEKCFTIVSKYRPDMIVFGYSEIQEECKKIIPVKLNEGFYNKNQMREKIFSNLLMDEEGECFPRALWAKVFRRDVVLENLYKVPEIIRNGEDMCCVVSCVIKSETMYILSDNLYFYRIEVKSSLSRSGDALAMQRCKIMAKYLNGVVSGEILLEEQFWRLLVQQMYSAVLRTSDKIGIGKQFNKEFDDLMEETLCKEAISKACFSAKAKKLKLKQIILKYRIFGLINILKKMVR